MDDFELLLEDRLHTIREMNKKYDLENNAYLSFSGGKDSTLLHYLLDMALPNNKIPRVFINTGIEYLYITQFVKDLADEDDRFVLLKPTKPIKQVLETYGYPFKSKQHSHNVSIYQHSGETTTIQKYLGKIGDKPTMFRCPKQLEYQFTKEFNIKCGDKCCYKLKKEPAHKWQEETGKSITITGMRKEEGGNRNNLNCVVTDKDGKAIKFHPLAVVSDEWEDWFIQKYNIELCKLYLPPFNFKRTGCKGCPFALDLQKQLDVMEKLLPAEKKQCEMIWKPVYEEYRRIGYRLSNERQTNIFDFIEEEKD